MNCGGNHEGNDYPAIDTLIKRLSIKQMHQQDCLLLHQVDKSKHPMLIIFNSEVGNFSHMALIKQECTFQLADVCCLP